MWEWLGNNAVGLIQIVIGVVASIFAIFGYFKILEQIKISNKQEKYSQDLRRFEIKLSVLKTNADYLNIIFEIDILQLELQNILDNKIFNSNNSQNIEKYQKIQELLYISKEKINSIDSIYNSILVVFDKSFFDLQFLEKTYIQYENQVNGLIKNRNAIARLKHNIVNKK